DKFVGLAGIWRLVTEIYARMRFLDWQWRANQGEHRGCIPRDIEGYKREEAGAIRYQLFLHDRVVPRLADEGDITAYLRERDNASQSITVPLAGNPWDGNVDTAALKALSPLTPFRIGVEEYVHHRHYQSLIDRVHVGSLGWKEWVTGKEVLSALAD